MGLSVCLALVACNDDVTTNTSIAPLSVNTSILRPSEDPLLALAAQAPTFSGYYCENGDLIVGTTSPPSDPAAEALRQSVIGTGVAFYCHNRCPARQFRERLTTT